MEDKQAENMDKEQERMMAATDTSGMDEEHTPMEETDTWEVGDTWVEVASTSAAAGRSERVDT